MWDTEQPVYSILCMHDFSPPCLLTAFLTHAWVLPCGDRLMSLHGSSGNILLETNNASEGGQGEDEWTLSSCASGSYFLCLCVAYIRSYHNDPWTPTYSIEVEPRKNLYLMFQKSKGEIILKKSPFIPTYSIYIQHIYRMLSAHW